MHGFRGVGINHEPLDVFPGPALVCHTAFIRPSSPGIMGSVGMSGTVHPKNASRTEENMVRDALIATKLLFFVIHFIQFVGRR